MAIVLALSTPAVAGRADDVQTSEYHRLAQELSTLAGRQAWTGVERTYRAMVALGVPMTAADHRRAADAARSRGDITALRERLAASVRLEENRDAIETLWSIDAGMGRARLEGAVELRVVEGVWLPEAVAAVDFAAEQLAREGVFEGYLPPGTYRFGELTVVIVAGEELQRVHPAPRSR